jgi:signal transduction histidine kinase
VATAGVEAALGLREAAAAQEQILQEMLALNEALSTQSADLSMARMTAERALQRQTSFLAGLSHELRTPLNGVLGGLSLLDAAPDADRRAQYQKMIRASAKTLGECVDDLLTYCRLGAGIDAPEFTAFDPRALAAEAVESASAFAAEKGLTVRAEIDDATPAEWMSDGRRIGKLLVNLLGNAVKYTAEGGVALSIAPVEQDLAFRVIDTGRGVPPAMAEAIFEPFNRGDPDTARSTQGTGLGLAIARETAQRLGGSLTLERSAPGTGSTFLLRVPRRETLTAGDDALFGG